MSLPTLLERRNLIVDASLPGSCRFPELLVCCPRRRPSTARCCIATRETRILLGLRPAQTSGRAPSCPSLPPGGDALHGEGSGFLSPAQNLLDFPAVTCPLSLDNGASNRFLLVFFRGGMVDTLSRF